MPFARKLNGAFVSDPSESVSCGTVEDARFKRNAGVVVPIPTALRGAMVRARSPPTVNPRVSAPTRYIPVFVSLANE